jgi:Mycotoxin biosynthesis protein UstYa
LKHHGHTPCIVYVFPPLKYPILTPPKLYYSVDTYHQLVVNNKFGFKGERNDYHAAHCFEYLRTQILCMADMTLEGSQSVLDATGDGQAHMCRNRDEAIAWIEARRVDDIQSIVGP